jgi:hypothetical protein
MTDTILYRFALDADGIVRDASTAQRGAKFTCVDHGCEMVLRRGEVNAPHFAHLPGEGGGCSVESAEHKAAKSLLVAAFNTSNDAPVIHRMCSRCHVLIPGESQDSINPSAWARQEYQYGARRIDVACLLDDEPCLFVEVLHTHAVDLSKMAELDASGIRWIEVLSSDVLADVLHLKPLGSTLRFGWCPACVVEFAKLEESKAEAQRQRFEREAKSMALAELWKAQDAIARANREAKQAELKAAIEHQNRCSSPIKIGETSGKSYWCCYHCRKLIPPMSHCLTCGAGATFFLGYADGAAA